MKYDFDRVIDRKNTDSLKYDFAQKRGMPEDILPLWVADMDFEAPKEVVDALILQARHGIFGYSESRNDYYEILERWFSDQFHWKIKPEWLVKTPGVVFAVTTAIRGFSNVGDGVLIQEPVYYPFKESIEINDRQLVVNELVYENEKYHIDFEDFEQKIINGRVTLFILCSPHNPVGRVWTKEELTRIGDICLKHGVLVIADEIHMDFTYPGNQHFIFADIKPEFLDITIMCSAPSKTFNLAGLQISNVFIANKYHRRRFKKEITMSGYSQMNIMGLVACKAAYDKGGDWLKELKEYLYGNINFIRNYLLTQLPEIKLIEPEGTYLIWLDCRSLGLSEEDLEELIIKKAGLWLDKGSMFGPSGVGFQRINIACPRVILERAMKQLEGAIKGGQYGRIKI